MGGAGNHVINVYNWKGRVYFVDGQIGGPAQNLKTTKNLQLMRTG